MSDSLSFEAFRLDSDLSADDCQFLEDRINAFNIARTGHDDYAPLGFALRGADGAMVAGIDGWTWGGACQIRNLWVSESLRGKGIGQRLLTMAENEARRRGCAVIVLDTHSFQAPDFYAKQGYTQVGVMEDYPIGQRKHFFGKRLTR